MAVTDQVIRDHLQGRHVVGVYPLLTDETCWLTAADFDKGSWITATPRRRDGLHPILEMQLGPVRFAVDASSAT